MFYIFIIIVAQNGKLDKLKAGGICAEKRYVHFTHTCTLNSYLPEVDYCCCTLNQTVLNSLLNFAHMFLFTCIPCLVVSTSLVIKRHKNVLCWRKKWPEAIELHAVVFARTIKPENYPGG